MIDLTATRDLLAQVITGVTVDGQPLHVYRGAITGHLQVPTAVLGIPEHQFATGPCMDTTDLPIGVIVGRSGADDAKVQAELEQVTNAVIAAVTTAIDSGLILDVCASATLRRADYDQVGVAGVTYPAYVLTLELNG